jgi:CPA2 family monovalent cation:H+ antiporter-2
MSGLELTLLYLLAAVVGVVVSRSLKLPPMLGYLAVGVVIGPNALALGNNAEGVRRLGEFGVVFLMFVIGLEFNLPKLRAMRRHVFGLGLAQVMLTILLATAGSLFLAALAPTLWRMSWQTALTLSGALAMSSTAIVVKLMAERLELESEHGKRVMGVLLFQDLAVVPLLVLIPALGSPPDQLLLSLGVAALKAAALITVLFFISIGMLLDWRLVWERWGLVLLLVTVPVLFKLLLVTVPARMLGASMGVSLRTGLYLAQAGEFGFVLLTLGQQSALVPARLFNPILASMVISMLASPFIVMYSNRIVLKLVAGEWLQQSLQMTTIARKSINTSKHVIICGYGRCGQNLARMLEREGIPYLALDLDPDRVRQAAAAGDSVVYGDAARLQALMAAGLARASAVVVTYLDVASDFKVLGHARSHAPQVPVIVRTIDDSNLETLQAAGATEVVPETLEASMMLASHALALVGVPMRRVIRIVQDQRDARYSLLRGYFHGADDDTVNERDQERLSTVTLPPDASAIGQPLSLAALNVLGVRIASLRRANGQPVALDSQPLLRDGDALVLSGVPESLALAEEKLLRG